jgi:precorrin-3B methylase
MRRGLLKLVGLGLGSPDYFTKAALRELERSDVVYLDTYTGFLEERAISELRHSSERGSFWRSGGTSRRVRGGSSNLPGRRRSRWLFRAIR